MDARGRGPADEGRPRTNTHVRGVVSDYGSHGLPLPFGSALLCWSSGKRDAVRHGGLVRNGRGCSSPRWLNTLGATPPTDAPIRYRDARRRRRPGPERSRLHRPQRPQGRNRHSSGLSPRIPALRRIPTRDVVKPAPSEADSPQPSPHPRTAQSLSRVGLTPTLTGPPPTACHHPPPAAVIISTLYQPETATDLRYQHAPLPRQRVVGLHHTDGYHHTTPNAQDHQVPAMRDDRRHVATRAGRWGANRARLATDSPTR